MEPRRSARRSYCGRGGDPGISSLQVTLQSPLWGSDLLPGMRAKQVSDLRVTTVNGPTGGGAAPVRFCHTGIGAVLQE